MQRQNLDIGVKVKWMAGAFLMEGAIRWINKDGSVQVKTHYRDNAVYVANVTISDTSRFIWDEESIEVGGAT